MELTEILLIILCAATLIVGIISVVLIIKKGNRNTQTGSDEIANIVRNEIGRQMSTQRQELSYQMQSTVKNMGDMISTNQSEKMSQLEERIKTFSLENEQKLETSDFQLKKGLNTCKMTTTVSLKK